MKVASISDRALVSGWMAGLLVSAFGGVAAVNAPRLFPDSLGGVPGTALIVCAGIGILCAIVCGIAMSRRAE